MNKNLSTCEGNRGEHLSVESLSDIEQSVICEVANIVVGAATTALSKIIEKKVEIGHPEIHITTGTLLSVSYSSPFIAIKIQYAEGFVGENLLLIKTKDAAVIKDLMMGGSGDDTNLNGFNELVLGAMSEVMNQMMGSAASSLSSIFKRKVMISTPEFPFLDRTSRGLASAIGDGGERFIQVAFKILVVDFIESQIVQIMPMLFAKEMASFLIGEMNKL